MNITSNQIEKLNMDLYLKSMAFQDDYLTNSMIREDGQYKLPHGGKLVE